MGLVSTDRHGDRTMHTFHMAGWSRAAVEGGAVAGRRPQRGGAVPQRAELRLAGGGSAATAGQIR
uniref:Uncharacterized protein n=1 Tax=Arundo donax TaxID=35708 RepID=A0A0A9UFI4_ARUDO